MGNILFCMHTKLKITESKSNIQNIYHKPHDGDETYSITPRIREVKNGEFKDCREIIHSKVYGIKRFFDNSFIYYMINRSYYEKYLTHFRGIFRRLEESLITKYPWYLKGEVMADKRPINSALDVDMDFKWVPHVLTQPIIVTRETLEIFILKRVNDRRFDNIACIKIFLYAELNKNVAFNTNKTKGGPSDFLDEAFLHHFVKQQNQSQLVRTGMKVILLNLSDESEKKMAKIIYRELCFKLDKLFHCHIKYKLSIDESIFMQQNKYVIIIGNAVLAIVISIKCKIKSAKRKLKRVNFSNNIMKKTSNKNFGTCE